MRKILAGLTIKQKFSVLILVIVIGFGIFGWQTLKTLSLVKVNGTLYKDIVSGKDLTADILPPPEYILESYLTVLELNNETDVSKIEKEIELLAQLKINYLRRHEYWLQQLHGKTMETVFLKDSYEPAILFYEIVEKQFIPAVRRGDAQMKRRLLEREINAAYLEHRKQIDKVVGLASKWSSNIEKHAQNTTDSSIIALAVLISIVLGCTVILSLYLANIISSEEKYRKFFQDDLSGVYLATPQGKILDCNQAFAKMFGFDSIDAVLNSNTGTFYKKTDGLKYFLDRLRHEKKLFNYEEVLKKQNGQQIITLENVIGIFNKREELTSFQGYIFDITERKQAEFEIKTANKILSEERKMFVDGPVVVFKWKNEEGWPVEYVSPNVENVFGYTSEELTSGKIPYANIILKEDIERIGTEVSTYSVSGVENFVHKPYRIIRKDGKVIWIDDYTTILRDENQKITHYQGYVIDITKHKLAEEELRFANTILKTQQEASIDGILVVDEGANIVVYNHRFVEMWGLPSELVEKKVDEPVLMFVVNQVVDPLSFLQRVKYLYENKREISRDEIVLKNGWIFDRYTAPMVGLDDRYYGRVWFFRDVTERKRTEEELRKHRENLEELVWLRTQELKEVHAELVRKERLATLGKLTAIVSHELRNPLGTIRNSIFEFNERIRGNNSDLDKA
ncbi:MAG: PAS domain S-box protein, partial [Ignavibacteria bacterium]|nr:PAS domain S-box protein [Ignavibacteria bacterium]